MVKGAGRNSHTSIVDEDVELALRFLDGLLRRSNCLRIGHVQMDELHVEALLGEVLPA